MMNNSSTKLEYCDSNMDDNNIDENMTVPHPSQMAATSPQSSHNQLYASRANLQLQQQQQQQLLHGQSPMQPAYQHDHVHLHQHHQALHQNQQQIYGQPQHQQQYYTNQIVHRSQSQPQPQRYFPRQVPQQLQQQPQELTHMHNPQTQVSHHHLGHDEIMEQLQGLVNETQQTDELVKMNRDAYQNFVLQLQHRSKLVQNITYQENTSQPGQAASMDRARRDLAAFEVLLRQKASELNDIRVKLVQAQWHIFNRMSVIQKQVVYEELARWHRDQQHSNNGMEASAQSAPVAHLDQIQTWAEKLVNITWRLKNQVKGLQLTLVEKTNVPFNTKDLHRFIININRSLEELILNTFVVEKQPPQVMKTNTRFTSTVRFLSGPRLNVQMISPTVTTVILSENNARAIIQRHKEMIESSWAYMDSQQQPQDQSPVGTSPGGIISPPSEAVNYYMDTSDSTNHSAGSAPQQVGSATNMTASASNHQHSFQQEAQNLSYFSQFQYQQQFAAQYSHRKIVNIEDFEPSGEILNNTNPLEYQESTGQLLSHFRNMQLRKIKRTEKKGTESVMDEKFVLLFYMDFRLVDETFCSFSTNTANNSNANSPSNNNSSSSGSGGSGGGSGGQAQMRRGDLSFQLMAFSLPVVVIVHGNQEPHAWATVTWHNAFATPDELLYQVPDKVKWRELGHVLSEKFRSCAGKGLNKTNLDYLVTKVHRTSNGSAPLSAIVMNYDDVLISWNQFAKEPLAERSFTFWEWFHSILKLTKEHLRNLWNDNRIYGFVGKEGCCNLMLGGLCHEPLPVGTFLLRYSETELGGITIAWVSSKNAVNKLEPGIQVSQRLSPTMSSSNVILHLQPFSSKDLNTRSLADRIRDLKDLVYLYPDVPKDEAFKAFYTPLNETSLSSNGYVMPMLIQTLATHYSKNSTSRFGYGGGGPSAQSSTSMEFIGATNATPSPPNSFSQSSPDGGIYQDSGMGLSGVIGGPGAAMDGSIYGSQAAYDTSTVAEFNGSM